MTKKKIVTRQFKTDFKVDEENENRIIGRPVVLNEETDLGWCREIIDAGALDNTDLTDVLFFINHDINKIPLARSRRNNANSTMRIQVDKFGMSIIAELDVENNTEAKNLHSAISRGDMDGMSFMFGVDNEEWEDLESDKPLRRVKSISRIIEVSAVNFPAYPQTEIDARDKESLETLKAKIAEQRNSSEQLELEKLKVGILYK